MSIEHTTWGSKPRRHLKGSPEGKCPIGGKAPIDGCYFCGRPVREGNHHHTDVGEEHSKTGYSCVCDAC